MFSLHGGDILWGDNPGEYAGTTKFIYNTIKEEECRKPTMEEVQAELLDILDWRNEILEMALEGVKVKRPILALVNVRRGAVEDTPRTRRCYILGKNLGNLLSKPSKEEGRYCLGFKGGHMVGEEIHRHEHEDSYEFVMARDGACIRELINKINSTDDRITNKYIHDYTIPLAGYVKRALGDSWEDMGWDNCRERWARKWK